MHKSTWGTSLVIINVDVIPDTFHRRSQLIPPKQVRVPYLHQNSIPGLHCSPLHANPTRGVRRGRRRRGRRLRGNESLRVAGELRRGGAGGGFGAACTRSGAQGREPVPGRRRRLGKAKRQASMRGGKPLVRRAAFGGLVRRETSRRRRASSSEQRRERQAAECASADPLALDGWSMSAQPARARVGRAHVFLSRPGRPGTSSPPGTSRRRRERSPGRRKRLESSGNELVGDGFVTEPPLERQRHGRLPLDAHDSGWCSLAWHRGGDSARTLIGT